MSRRRYRELGETAVTNSRDQGFVGVVVCGAIAPRVLGVKIL